MRELCLLVLSAAAAAAAAGAGEAASSDPKSIVAGALVQPDPTAAMAGLRVTDDKELLPIFAAMLVGGGEEQRLLALEMHHQLAGADGAKALMERLVNDPSPGIRRMAMAQLLDLKALNEAQLTRLAGDSDVGIRMMAARALIAADPKNEAAAATLKALIAKADARTVALARATMLAAGDQSQLAPVTDLLASGKTREDLVMLVMKALADDKTVAAAPAISAYAAAQPPGPTRARALTTLLAVDPKSAGKLADEIAASNLTVYRVNLLRALAQEPSAGDALKGLGQSAEPVASLARLELARRGESSAAVGEAALAAVQLGVPIAADHALECARQDIAAGSKLAVGYGGALLALVNAGQSEATQMGQDQMRAAIAAAVLMDAGDADGVKAIAAILAGRHDARQRAVAAALMRTANAKVACELAAPLLKAPQQELRTDAMLTLGRWGDTRAREALAAVVADPRGHSTPLVVQAAWYLIKLDGQGAAAAAQIARQVVATQPSTTPTTAPGQARN
jgi:hypothetical protein